MTPRWTYTEANASRWRPLFDDLLASAPPIEIPLEGNAKSLCSLKVRICDALKWLADGFHKHHNPSMKFLTPALNPKCATRPTETP